jgi:hypothetical protein
MAVIDLETDVVGCSEKSLEEEEDDTQRALCRILTDAGESYMNWLLEVLLQFCVALISRQPLP